MKVASLVDESPNQTKSAWSSKKSNNSIKLTRVDGEEIWGVPSGWHQVYSTKMICGCVLSALQLGIDKSKFL